MNKQGKATRQLIDKLGNDIELLKKLREGAINKQKEKKKIVHLSMLLGQINEGIAIIEPSGSFLYASDIFAEVYGYLAEDLVDKHISEFHDSKRAKDYLETFSDILESGELKIKTVHTKKDGTKFHAEIHDILIKDNAGKPTAIFRSIKGIENIEDLEEELKYRIGFEKLIADICTQFINMSNEELDSGINAALQTIGRFFKVDRSYVFLFRNDSKMVNTYEWCKPGIVSQIARFQNISTAKIPWLIKQLRNKKIVYIPRVDELPAKAEAEKKEFQTEKVKSLICIPLIFGGSVMGFMRFGSVISEKTYSEDHINCLNIIGEIFASALSKKRSEIKIKESEEKYTSLVQNINIGIYRSTPEPRGKFLEINPAFVEMFGYKNKKELLSIKVSELFPCPGDRKKFSDVVLSLGQVRNFESKLKRKDGSHIICSETCKAVKNEKGEIIFFDGIIENITDRKKMEQMLIQSEKMASLGTIAAGVAHEINNPIGYVLSNLELLEDYTRDLRKFFNGVDSYAGESSTSQAGSSSFEDKFSSEKKEANIGYLLKNLNETIMESMEGATRISRIVNDLKDFSRIEKPERQEADINKGLEKTINIIWNEIKYKAEIEKVFGDIPNINCDINKLNQVFMNILINAAQAIENSGRITIKTFSSDDHIFVKVADTGHGITQENVNQIFDAFFTTKEPGKGTGLGLAISYRVIKDHNGNIDVESEVGKGTTFTISLPLRESQEVLCPKVLVVDDDIGVREYIKDAIKEIDSKFVVKTAKNGFEAAEILYQFKPSVIFLDIKMPDIDGFEVCKKIKTDKTLSTKVIAISGYDIVDLAERMDDAGMDYFVEKPVRIDELKKLLV